MASAEDYASWIVKNADKKGTPEFDTVSKAYQEARSAPAAPAAAPPSAPAIVPGQSFHQRIAAGFADTPALKQIDANNAALGTEGAWNAVPGVLTGAASQIGGIGGEIGNLASGVADVAGMPGVAQGIRDYNPLPNMDQFGDLIAGPAENDQVTAFRKLGQVIGPGPLLKVGRKGVGAITGLGQGEPTQAAINAYNAKYVLPPRMVTKGGQSAEQQLGSAASGKAKTNQYFSLKNQPNTNRLAAEDIQLPGDAPLTREAITGQRAKFAADKAAIVNSLPQVASDKVFQRAIRAVGGRESAAAKEFPDIVKSAGVEDLARSGSLAQPAWSSEAAAGLVVDLRDQASANLKTIGPGARASHALGLAQKQAADAMDDLIARNLVKNAGEHDPGYGLSQKANYEKARELMAKTYDVEDVTDFTTGDVNAHAVHRLSKAGRPLSGGLATIAEAAGNFRGAVQPAQMVGGMEHASVLDYYLMAHAGARADPASAIAVAGRMAARPFLASKFNQAKIMQQSPAPVTLPGHPYTFAPSQAQVQAGADASRSIPGRVLGLRHVPPTLNALNLYLGSGQQ